MKKFPYKPLVWVIVTLLILVIIATVFTKTKFLVLLSLAFSFLSYFVIPGYMILLFLDLDSVEHTLLSIPISGAIMPVIFYFASLVSIPLSSVVIWSAIILIIVVSLIFFELKTKKQASKHTPKS